MKRQSVFFVWLALSGLTILGSVVPGVWIPTLGVPGFVTHALTYFVLALVPIACFRQLSAAVATVIAVLALGLSLEVAQTIIPARALEWSDIVADLLGVLAGFGVGFIARSTMSLRLVE